MRRAFLGDSYDIVKQSLLRWLNTMGPWATHPMFTGKITDDKVDEYERLIGTPLLSKKVLTNGTDRNAYLSPARECPSHVFLDPDTGIRIAPLRGKKALAFIFAEELLEIISYHEDRLVLVFDQSLDRGSEETKLKEKLTHFRARGIYSMAYLSHACFVLFCKNEDLIEQAFDTLLSESRLPRDRFVTDKET
jgi:hypothetical protein